MMHKAAATPIAPSCNLICVRMSVSMCVWVCVMPCVVCNNTHHQAHPRRDSHRILSASFIRPANGFIYDRCSRCGFDAITSSIRNWWQNIYRDIEKHAILFGIIIIIIVINSTYMFASCGRGCHQRLHITTQKGRLLFGQRTFIRGDNVLMYTITGCNDHNNNLLCLM